MVPISGGSYHESRQKNGGEGERKHVDMSKVVLICGKQGFRVKGMQKKECEIRLPNSKS